MRLRRLSKILLVVLCVLSLTAAAVSVFALADENTDPFLIAQDSYTGALDPSAVTVQNGYCSVPSKQGGDNWYLMAGDTVESLQEIAQKSDGNYDDNQGYGFWWQYQYGVWVDKVIACVWQAPADGAVAFSGKIVTSNPDVTVLSVYRKVSAESAVETLYSQPVVSGTQAMMVADEAQKSVAAGETYYFVISRTESASGDANANGEIMIKADYKQYGFLVDESLYGGTLTKEAASSDNAYLCIPDASTEAQGTDNWYALYGDAEGAYNQMTKAESGSNAYWQGGAQYNNIWWSNEFSPDGNADAIAMWRAPYNGTVKFSGVIYKDSMDGSGGVVIRAYNRKSASSASVLLAESTQTQPFALFVNEGELDVVSGEMYFFCVDQKGESSFDTTKVFIKAEFTKDEAAPGDPADGDIGPSVEDPEASIFSHTPAYALGAQEDYYGVPNAQGENNTYILYGKADGMYAKMTAVGEDGNHWKGSSEFNEVWWKQDFGPDGGDDAIIAWRAPYNGTVKFTGWIAKDFSSSGSDGIVVKAYNRKTLTGEVTELYKQAYDQTFRIYFNGAELDVVSGEMYFFCIGQGGTSADDSTKVLFHADFVKDADNPGEPAGDDIGPVTEDPAACIFNQTPSYVIGAQDDYLGVPNAQGENNTWVLYGKADGKYYEMTTQATDGNSWKGSAQYNGIDWKQDFSPDGNDDAIIAWRAPFNGTVKFTGWITKDFAGSASDGIIVKAYNRKTLTGEVTELYNQLFDETFKIYFNGVELDVVSGEMYFFAIDQNVSSAYDSTKVFFRADFVKDEENPGTEATGPIGCARTVDYLSYYSEEQGGNNWFYAMGSIEKYALMDFGVSKNSGEKQYNGMVDWQGISAGNMTPGTYASMRIYVCDKDGVISIEGKINKTGEGGDGANVKIYHNKTAIFEYAFGASLGSVDLPQDLKYIEVSKGDLIVYYVDAGSAGSNSYDNITFASEIFWESSEGEAAEDVSVYISPVSKLELQGINLPDPVLDENEDYTDGPEGGNKTLIIVISAVAAVLVVGGGLTAFFVIRAKKRGRA